MFAAIFYQNRSILLTSPAVNYIITRLQTRRTFSFHRIAADPNIMVLTKIFFQQSSPGILRSSIRKGWYMASSSGALSLGHSCPKCTPHANPLGLGSHRQIQEAFCAELHAALNVFQNIQKGLFIIRDDFANFTKPRESTYPNTNTMLGSNTA